MGIGRLFNDLHRVANSGQRVRLKSGVEVIVKATSFAGCERLDAEFPGWLGRVFRHFEQGGFVSPAALDQSVELLLRDLKAFVPSWQEALLFILRDSNPELQIDIEWLRANVSPLVDARRIFRAWIAENEFEDVAKALKKKVIELLPQLVTMPSAGSSQT